MRVAFQGFPECTAAILTGTTTTKVLPGTFGLLQKMKLTAPITGILIMVVQMYTEIPYIKIQVTVFGVFAQLNKIKFKL